MGLSWYGLAGPWVEEWRHELQQQTTGIVDNTREGLLFDDLDRERRERLDQLFHRAQLLGDGCVITEMILGQVGRQARNPVRIPAEAFRVLLRLERHKDWKARVEGGLNALRACTFRVTSFDMKPVKGYGSFIAEWWYMGAGPEPTEPEITSSTSRRASWAAFTSSRAGSGNSLPEERPQPTTLGRSLQKNSGKTRAGGADRRRRQRSSGSMRTDLLQRCGRTYARSEESRRLPRAGTHPPEGSDPEASEGHATEIKRGRRQ